MQGRARRWCLECRPPRRGEAYHGLSVEDIKAIVDGVPAIRVRFPHGCCVIGPFRVNGDGTWGLGKGLVDWGMVGAWAVPHCAVPVQVILGNRFSGGYLADELKRDPVPTVGL